jgi:hypothetical protein
MFITKEFFDVMDLIAIAYLDDLTTACIIGIIYCAKRIFLKES